MLQRLLVLPGKRIPDPPGGIAGGVASGGGAVSKLLDNLLEGTGIKPYILQRQHVNCYSGVWDTLYDRQYDTLEEAEAALLRLQGAGHYRYRIAQAAPRIVYEPVKAG